MRLPNPRKGMWVLICSLTKARVVNCIDALMRGEAPDTCAGASLLLWVCICLAPGCLRASKHAMTLARGNALLRLVGNGRMSLCREGGAVPRHSSLSKR